MLFSLEKLREKYNSWMEDCSITGNEIKRATEVINTEKDKVSLQIQTKNRANI